MPLSRRLSTRFARPLLALAAAFAQLVAATGAPLPAAPKQPDSHARADLAPANPVGSCGVGACCCAPVAAEPACGCCAPKPVSQSVVWVGGTFQQKCHDFPMAAGLLKFEFLGAALTCEAVSLPVPGRAFAPASSTSLPRTAAEPPVPPPKLPVM
jgi:hypothetical protein